MSISVLGSAKKNHIIEGIFTSITTENGLQLVGVAGDHFTYLRLYKELKPDVVLLCTKINGQSTLGLIREMVDKHPDIKIISIGSSYARQTVLETINAGARAYLSPISSDAQELLRAIHSVMNGTTYICKAVWNPASCSEAFNESYWFNQPATHSALSAREEQVIGLLADGNSSREIARHLHIATTTVDVHRKNIMVKTGLHNITELTRYAIRYKLIAT